MLLYESHKSIIYALAFSSDGLFLASGDRDGQIAIHHVEGTSQVVPNHDHPLRAIYALAFAPNLPVLAFGGEAGWQCRRQRDDNEWETFGPSMVTPTMDLAFLDRNTLAVGLGERLNPAPGRFELWNISAGRRVDPFFVEAKGVRAVAVCPRKNVVAWSASQRHVKVWDTRKQDPLGITHPSNCQSLAINRDATWLAIAGDWLVRLYDLQNKREAHVLKVHKGQVSSVAFSPDGQTLATGSWDRTVRLWDVASGREQRVYEWPIGRVNKLTYSPDGSRLAAGGDTGGVVVWDLD